MSKLEVCNQALLLVKQPPVFDLDATSSQSRTLNIIYDRSYAHLLSSHYFNYALKTAELVAISGVTPFVGFSSVRAMPQGALSLKDVVDADGRQVKFRIGADGIHVTSGDILYAEYTYTIDIDKTSADKFFKILAQRMPPSTFMVLSANCKYAELNCCIIKTQYFLCCTLMCMVQQQSQTIP